MAGKNTLAENTLQFWTVLIQDKKSPTILSAVYVPWKSNVEEQG